MDSSKCSLSVWGGCSFTERHDGSRSGHSVAEHGARSGDGHSGVHVTGASAWRNGRGADEYLESPRGALRDGCRLLTLRGQHTQWDQFSDSLKQNTIYSATLFHDPS